VYLKFCIRKLLKVERGISSWLPKFFYKLPIKNKNIEKYKKAKEIIYKKTSDNNLELLKNISLDNLYVF